MQIKMRKTFKTKKADWEKPDQRSYSLALEHYNSNIPREGEVPSFFYEDIDDLNGNSLAGCLSKEEFQPENKRANKRLIKITYLQIFPARK
jgi:hypothetical protein